MLKWNESYGQWTVEKMLKRKRLFRRLPGEIGKDREAEARAIAAKIVAEFRQAALEDEGSHGYIYAVSNPAFPGLLKIGMTGGSPELRLRQLSALLPEPCKLEFAVTVQRMKGAERDVHRELAEHRVNPRREWFRVSVSRAVGVMTAIAQAQTIG